MKNKFKFPLLSITLILLLSFNYCIGQNNAGEIPITTSSEKAHELFIEGRNAAEVNRWEKCIKLFKEAVELDSNFCLAYYYLSDYSKSPSEQQNYMEKADACKNFASKGEQILVDINWASLKNDKEKCISLAQDLINIYPKSPRAYLILSDQYIASKNIDDGRKAIKNALELDDKSSPAYFRLAFSYLFDSPKDFDLAENNMLKYLKFNPNEPYPYISLGDVYRGQNQLEKAKVNYTKAIDIDNTYAEAYSKRGHANTFLNNFDAARSDYTKAKEFSPNEDQIGYRNFYINTYLYEGKIEKALKENASLIKNTWDMDMSQVQKNFSNFINYFNRIQIAIENQKLKIAGKSLGEFETLGKKVIADTKSDDLEKEINAELLIFSGLLEAQKNNFSTSLNLAKELYDIKIKENNPRKLESYYGLMGMIKYKQKDYANAVSHYEKTDLDSDMYYKFYLGLALTALGDNEKAKKILTEVINWQFNDINNAMVRKKAIEKLSELN
jgi:tetratricopeptide (TPR) repeat protein